MSDEKEKNEKKQPSAFQPWVSRVRMMRSWGSSVALVTVGSLSYVNGASWEDAAIKALIAGTVAYFLTWVTALWVASELHQAEVRRLKMMQQNQNQQRIAYLQQYADKRDSGAGTIDLSGTGSSGRAA